MSDIQAAAEEVKKLLGGKGLDILINNIGIGQEKYPPADLTELHIFREQFEVNVIGNQLVTLALLPLLRAGNRKILANMSSIVGSITYNDGRNQWVSPAYGASKAALNFLTRDYSKDLGKEGFTVIPLYPGWVKTPAAPGATMEVEESATAILKLIFGLTRKDNGQFYSYDGSILDW